MVTIVFMVIIVYIITRINHKRNKDTQRHQTRVVFPALIFIIIPISSSDKILNQLLICKNELVPREQVHPSPTPINSVIIRLYFPNLPHPAIPSQSTPQYHHHSSSSHVHLVPPDQELGYPPLPLESQFLWSTS